MENYQESLRNVGIIIGNMMYTRYLEGYNDTRIDTESAAVSLQLRYSPEDSLSKIKLTLESIAISTYNELKNYNA